MLSLFVTRKTLTNLCETRLFDMESATSQEEADVLGAYSDFRTPFELVLMDEKLFFHPTFKKEERRGKNVAA